MLWTYISDRSCFTNGGANQGANCVFPFTFAGRTHDGCTLKQTDEIWESGGDARRNERLWCSTKTDHNGKHVGGQEQWGYCGHDCSIDIEGVTRSYLYSFASLVDKYHFILKFWPGNPGQILAPKSVNFSTIFRQLQAYTLELDEDFGWVSKKYYWVRSRFRPS